MAGALKVKDVCKSKILDLLSIPRPPKAFQLTSSIPPGSMKGSLLKGGLLPIKKFSDKHWEKATKAYDLDFLIKNKLDSEPNNHDDDSNYGRSIDLEAESSSNDDKEEDK
ncbi:hypothetical protein PCANC_24814 [Puccinia coronata f. sp. avenae]|uniref:Uncharacterized protein n=1 Tax=Puccinia coronata f. sp. avenae TaxID=200324 RepID=A0A2N5V3E0_9BASI|nr:hypothetical protein PCANC_24814 [Puccinia coronata f. sp. avenae]PLW44525.1 hypothetical protein PCASD_11476 [Puccinia coronata f. sp. avenae]